CVIPVVAGLLEGAWYIQNWGYLQNEQHHFATAAVDFFKCIGGPADYVSGAYGLGFGLVAAVTAFWASLRLLRSDLDQESRIAFGFFAALSFICLGTAFMAVLGRVKTSGPVLASLDLPSRYTTGILILWVSITALAWLANMRWFCWVPVFLMIL